MSASEQESTFKALEELQKKDWKELSIDEKKAGKHNSRLIQLNEAHLGYWRVATDFVGVF